MISKDAQTQDDIVRDLEKLSEILVKASFTGGANTEELRAVEITKMEPEPTKD